MLRGFREQRTPRCVFFRNDTLLGRGEHTFSVKDHSREGCDLFIWSVSCERPLCGRTCFACLGLLHPKRFF